MPTACLCLLVLFLLLLGRGRAFAGESPEFARDERFVDVPGGRVWTLTINPGAGGTPLLIVHGGPGASHDYLANLSALAGKRPVIFYDQLDCGESGHPGDPSLWTLERSVAELDAVRRGLCLERVHLLGQSWGGAICAAFALGASDPGLSSLILCAPLVSAPQWVADQKTWLSAMPAAVQSAVSAAEASGEYDGEAYQRAMDAYYRRHLCRLTPWPNALERTFARMNAAMYVRMWGPSEFTVSGPLRDFDLSGRLFDIRVPALLTCGEFDEAAPWSVRRFAKRIPGASAAVLEGGSHMHHLECPERYAQLLERFLERAEAG